MCTTSLFTPDITAVAPFLRSLTEVVGTEFALWPATLTDTPHGQAGCTCDSYWNAEALALATSNARQDGFAVDLVNPNRIGICVRLPQLGSEPAFAFATMPLVDKSLQTRLVRLAWRGLEQDARIAQQAQDMESCIEQLTYGLEEQTWLRSLSNHMRLCSAKRSLLDVTEETIPSLRRLIGAEAIAVLIRGNSGSLASNSAADDSARLLWTGRKLGEDSLWKNWIDTNASLIGSLPLVLNGTRVGADFYRNSIRSLLAVQIGRASSIYGWIIAINRDGSELGVPDGTWGRTNDGEFGTVEAGLLEAAATMLATQGHNSHLLRDREDLIVGVIRAMGQAVDARDRYTRGHSERVGRYGWLLANSLGLSKNACDRIYLAGLLHDVGKIGIPDRVLGKTDPLNDEEFSIVRRHPEIGARIINTLPQLSDLLPGILHHHESVNGRGYPYGLVGSAISEMGRILAVADAYDAMTSDRPYRSGMPRQKAVEILQSRAGTQWDRDMVDAFVGIPEQTLILDATDGNHGWSTQEDWLRGGAKSMSGGLSVHHEHEGCSYEVLDDSLMFERELVTA